MSRLSTFSKLRVLVAMPLLAFHILFYHISKNKNAINSDINAWRKYRDWVPISNMSWALMCLLVLQPEFQMQFNLRIGRFSKFLLCYKSERGDLGQCKNIGNGFCLIHGYGTVINGSSKIGCNCTVLQGVTIGGRNGTPTIGDNVYIGAGAIIIGGITVGDNVKIGAGATVVSDIPANCTVVCHKARIIQH